MCAQIASATINTGVRSNPKVPFTSTAISILLAHTNAISCDLVNHRLGLFPLTPMAASRSEMFQKSIADESKIRKLIRNHFLPKREVLRCRPANGKDIPTPNTNEIVMLSSFVQRGFSLSTCEFLRSLLHHYEIELVHLKPNSILQIVVFVHLCKVFLGMPPNFPLFKSYFLLKYQPSANKWKVIGGVGLQMHHHNGFLDLPMKTSLKGWHKS
jgi:hypothetical protein